jgi:hypothetical protein
VCGPLLRSVVDIVFLRAHAVLGGRSALRSGDYVRLPVTGEPAVDLASPMANESPVGRQAIESEQDREIICGCVGGNAARLESRAGMANARSALAPDNRECHRSHTLSPRPANQTARLKGRTR